MDAEGYLQLLISVFIVIVVVLVFILYTQGTRSNMNRRVVTDRRVIVDQHPFIIGPGGQQWINTRPVVNPSPLLGPGGIYQYQ